MTATTRARTRAAKPAVADSPAAVLKRAQQAAAARTPSHIKNPGVGKGGATRGKELVPRQICEVCGTRFRCDPARLKRGHGRFCSTKCRGLATRGENNPHWRGDAPMTCRQCGKQYHRPRSQRTGDGVTGFCSRECAEAARLAARPRCVTCGSSVPKGHRKYCSNACRRVVGRKPGHTAIVNCEQCGTQFATTVSAVNAGLGRFCSRECFTQHKANNLPTTTHTRARGGRRADLNNRYFRSRWEANYARYLNWLVEVGQIRAWEYEPDTFEFAAIKRGTRFYIPDFKITNLDNSIEYHEVKGWMDDTSRVKLDRMARYYPNVKVVLIDKEAYRAIGQTMRRMLPNWEHDAKKFC